MPDAASRTGARADTNVSVCHQIALWILKTCVLYCSHCYLVCPGFHRMGVSMDHTPEIDRACYQRDRGRESLPLRTYFRQHFRHLFRRQSLWQVITSAV